MNQITQMLSDSNARMRRLMKALNGIDKPDMDVVASAQREMEQQIRAANLVVQAFAIASKNKRTMIGLDRMNIMDETTAVDLMLGDPETDKVKCPEQDALIYRADCLEYSGDHPDECSGCEIGRDTKARLLGPTE